MNLSCPHRSYGCVIQSADHFSMGKSIASRAKMTRWWWWGENYLNVIWNGNTASQQISVNRFEFLYNLSVPDQASEAFHHWTNNRYHPSYLNYHDRCLLTPCFMHNSFCLTAAVYVHRSPPSSTSTAPAAIAVAVAEIGMPIRQIYQTSSEPSQLPVQSRWMQMLSAVLSCNYQSRCILPILLLELLYNLTSQRLEFSGQVTSLIFREPNGRTVVGTWIPTNLLISLWSHRI